MSLLLIPLILAGVFILPFAMAKLEPQPKRPTHRLRRARDLGRRQP